MSQIAFEHDGLAFAGYDIGQGLPVVFQHGLGGDIGQINEALPVANFRRITLECRGQGQSTFGDSKHFTIPQFANDVLEFADSRGVKQFVLGGISMGAAIALRIAVTAPERVKALILARPAWSWNSSPENMSVFRMISKFVQTQDKAGFEATEIAKNFEFNAPDNYASLLRLFEKLNPALVAELHSRIAASGPEVTEKQVGALHVPTLILANEKDLIHPISLARELATTITSSNFVEIAPKAIDKTKHFAEFHAAVKDFLKHIEV